MTAKGAMIKILLFTDYMYHKLQHTGITSTKALPGEQ